MDSTYKIIGGDGREYGPATLEELKSWIADGRVGATTAVWRSDLERWAPALHYAEFQPEIGSAFPVVKGDAAGFWPRFAAYFLDFAILTSAVAMIWPFLSSHYGWKTDVDFSDFYPESKLPKNELQALLILVYSVRLVYEVGMNGAFGATVGKMALGMRIVKTDGRPIGFGFALVRWIGSRVSDSTFFLGYFLILIRPDRRALHDLLAGTKVIFHR